MTLWYTKKKEDAKKRKRTADLGVRPAHHRQVLAIIQLTVLIFVHWPFGVAPTQSEHRVRFLARKWCSHQYAKFRLAVA